MSGAQSWMLYGAAGHTGALIAQHARQGGHQPVLAGRNAAAVAALDGDRYVAAADGGGASLRVYRPGQRACGVHQVLAMAAMTSHAALMGNLPHGRQASGLVRVCVGLLDDRVVAALVLDLHHEGRVSEHGVIAPCDEQLAVAFGGFLVQGVGDLGADRSGAPG
jgi:hypothetical protein